MSPTYTMSAHLCKQIYTSWRQTRQTSPSPSPSLASSPPSSSASQGTAAASGGAATTGYFQQRPASQEKRSMDSDRDTAPAPMSRQSSGSSWRFGGR
jgi:hypothetical protein